MEGNKFKTGVVRFFSIIEGMAYIEKLESRGYTPENGEEIVMAPESGTIFFTRGGKYYIRTLNAAKSVKESNFYEFKWSIPKCSIFTPSSKKKVVFLIKLGGYIGQLKLLKLEEFGITGLKEEIAAHKFHKGVIITRSKEVVFLPDEESVEKVRRDTKYEVFIPKFLMQLSNTLL